MKKPAVAKTPSLGKVLYFPIKGIFCLGATIISLLLYSNILWAQATADFQANITSGCNPLVVSFTNLSTGSPDSVKWNLGNGSTSVLYNPQAIYSSPGTYTVSLTVYKGGVGNTLTKTNYVTVYNAPAANFSASQTNGCVAATIQFTDLSIPGSGSISSWIWDFGDGYTSTLQNPVHTYTAPGSFAVTLKVMNNFGCQNTITRQRYINLTEGVTARFTNSNPSSCTAPLTVSFTNNSAGPGILSYQWNFGDGSLSTASNPSHTYTLPGVYSVALIATSSDGCSDTLRKANLVRVAAFQSNFNAPSSICTNTTTTLINTTSPVPSSSTWYFSDGLVINDINATRSFNVPGNYTVKLVNDIGGCRDSVTKTITVSTRPTANFSAPRPNGCQLPFTVNFTNQSAGAAAWLWDFGDGTTSTQASPSHVYDRFGSYTVKLVVTNSAGCKDSLTQNNLIRIEPPIVSFTANPRSGCIPLTVNFKDSIFSVDSVVSYFWDFGDGTSSALRTPTHTYTTDGGYNVKLVITTAGGCKDSLVVRNAIAAGARPIADFDATPRRTCQSFPVQFTNRSQPPGDEWHWTFLNDNAVSDIQHPSRIFNFAGFHDIRLVVGNKGCYDTIVKTKFIEILFPVASIGLTPVNCNNKFKIVLQDRSQFGPNVPDNVKKWKWEIRDLTRGKLLDTFLVQNPPPYTLPDTGTYQIYLTVSQDSCQSYDSNIFTVIAEQPQLKTDKKLICRGNPVTFTATGLNTRNIQNYQWFFGDGSSLTTRQPTTTKTYANPGLYLVRVVTTDVNNCVDSSKTDTLIVKGPTANFSANKTQICPGDVVIFKDSSYPDTISPIKQWIWNYGDGSRQDTLLTKTPTRTHTYTQSGSYTVSLTVIDSSGCSHEKVMSTLVNVASIKAAFTSPDTLSCPGIAVHFTNTSSGNGLSYQWSFGDSTFSNQVNPQKSYSKEGVYSVKLVTTNASGCTDSLTRINYVKVAFPKAAFSFPDQYTTTCPPLVARFVNHSSNYLRVVWNFGDGSTSTLDTPTHVFNLPGSYVIQLKVFGYGGCIDSAIKILKVKGPLSTQTHAPFAGCAPFSISVRASNNKDVAKFIWDFTDGTVLAPSPDSSAVHTYTAPGVYYPKLIVEDADGCRTVIPSADSVVVDALNAAFFSSGSLVCDSGYVQFNNSTFSFSADSLGFPNQYHWDFGFPNRIDDTSSLASPRFFYNQAGNYPASLTVQTRFGCRQTTQSIIRVALTTRGRIVAPDTACVGSPIGFKGRLTFNPSSRVDWYWDFNNGKTYNGSDPPPVAFGKARKYFPSLMLTNAEGCTDTSVHALTVVPTPIPNVMPKLSNICYGQSVQLSASDGTRYQWSPPAGLSNPNIARPLATPAQNIQYKLLVSNQFGCISTDSVQINVSQPFRVSASPDTTICAGDAVTLSAFGAVRYLWTPAAGLSNVSTDHPRALPRSTTRYKVTGYGADACFTDSAFVNIRVVDRPLVNAGNDTTITVGSSVQLNASGTSDIIQWRWEPANGLSCTNCPNPVATPRQPMTYRVNVTNAYGCTNSNIVSINLICPGSVLFIPNSFTPNGDGLNDVFYPRGRGIRTIISFRIFNRWGEMVFERQNFAIDDKNFGWDGTYKGQALNPDVYIYTLEAMCDNNDPLLIKGNVTLLR